MSDVLDGLVIDKVLAGDLSAYGEIVSRYQQMIFKYVHAHISNYDESLDVTQDIFIAAMESMKSFRREAKFSTWLYSIAINVCRNYHRKNKRHETVSLYKSSPDGEETEMQFADERENIEEHLLKEESLEVMRQELAKLPDDYREVLVMRDVDGVSYEDIAAAIGIGLSNVKVRIHRGREMLKNRLHTRGIL